MSAALVEAALAIARRRARRLAELRLALERGDDAEALHLARILTGMEEESAEGDCPTPREH